MAVDTGAIRAGKAYVEMGLKDDGLKSGLANAQAQMTTFAKSLQTLGSAIAFTAIAQKLKGFVQSFADSGRELYVLSQRTGASVSQLDELKKAAAEFGVGFDDVSTALLKMQRVLGELSLSGQDSNDALQALGLTMTELRNMSPVDQFTLIGERIAAIADPARRAALMAELGGRGGNTVLPALAGLRAARGRAREGGVMSDVDAARAFELSRAFEGLDRAMGSIRKSIGSALAPAFAPILQMMSNAAAAVKNWVKQNETLVQILGAVVGVSTGIAAILTGIAGAAMIATSVWGGLVVAATAVGGVFTALVGVIAAVFSPVGLAIAGAAALAAGLVYLVSQTEIVKRAFASIGETFSQVWTGILDAFKAGDLGMVWSIVVAGMKVAWADFGNWFTQTFPTLARAFGGFADWISDKWSKTTDAISTAPGWLALINPVLGIPALARRYYGVSSEQVRRDNRDRRRGEEFLARQQISDPRGELAALLDQARQAREAADAARAARLPAPGAGGLDDFAKANGGARGTFNSAAAFGLVGPGNPVVQQLRELNRYAAETVAHLQELRDREAAFV